MAYRKRTERDTDPDNIVLQERDYQILEAIHTHRVMNREQIQQLFFGKSDHTAKRRLRKLYDHKYLDRIPIPTFTGAMPIVYVVDKKGASVLRRILGNEGLSWFPSSKRLKPGFMEHTLAVNDVMIAVTIACKQLGYTLDLWKSEGELKSRYTPEKDSIVISGKKGAERIPIIPDSYFVIRANGRCRHFFLELDRSTMSLSRFQTKVRGYKVFRTSGRCKERYGENEIDVLTVVAPATFSAGERRKTNLLRSVEKVGGVNDWFWFTTLSNLTPQRILTEPIWYLPASQNAKALLPKTG